MITLQSSLRNKHIILWNGQYSTWHYIYAYEERDSLLVSHRKKVPCITFFTRLTDDEYAEHYFNFNVCRMSARLSFVKLQFSIKFSSWSHCSSSPITLKRLRHIVGKILSSLSGSKQPNERSMYSYAIGLTFGLKNVQTQLNNHSGSIFEIKPSYTLAVISGSYPAWIKAFRHCSWYGRYFF